MKNSENINESDDNRIKPPDSDIKIPKELEAKVLDRLKENKLINAKYPAAYYLRRIAAVVALIGISFYSGWKFGSSKNIVNQHASNHHTKDYMMLLYENSDFITTENQNMEYGKWMGSFTSVNSIRDGNELTDGGWTFKKDNSNSIKITNESNGSYGKLSGYFIVNATSDDKAIEMASSSPHLNYNGIVELRKIK